MKKLLYFIAALCLIACEGNSPKVTIEGEFVDLGLSSGTKWKTENEFNPADSAYGFYRYAEAVRLFGSYLPTKQQWEELKNECTFTIIDDSWTRITGPNGNSIMVRKMGYRGTDNKVCKENEGVGYYWTSTYNSENNRAWFIEIGTWVTIMTYGGMDGLCVRLAKQ